MTAYQVTIGLEIHAQLKTGSKMFCLCPNDPDQSKPNVNICPICLGHPGALPVINQEAVKQLLRVGLAVGGTLADYTEFDRKHYFYPDIPKGYQISQHKYPLVSGGRLAEVELERIHLEEDTGRSTHDQGSRSLVDFNRSGLPLMELVTKPVIKSGKQAADFARELRLLLRYLEAGEANMEKGQMRVEANLSISADEKLGTKVEIKNLNSFRSVEKAVAYEIERQSELLQAGRAVDQETRGWDEAKQVTISQRSKEESHDYRYFPEPDLPPLQLSELVEFNTEVLQGSLPELPWQRRKRYQDLGLKQELAKTLTDNLLWGRFFESVCQVWDQEPETKLITLTANYITTDLAGLLKDESTETNLPISAEQFAKLMTMIYQGELSSRGGKEVLAKMISTDDDPAEIAKQEKLLQSADQSELEDLARQVIEANPEAVTEYRGGKEASLQFLIGQGMKLSGGSAHPQKLRSVLEQLL